MTEARDHSERKRLRRDIRWNLIPVVLLGGVGLGMTLGVGAWWGKTALGAFNLVTISFFAFAVLGAGGLQYAVLRAVAAAHEDRDHVASTVVGALVPVVVLAAASTALYLALRGVLASWQGEAVGEGMRWAAPGLFCFAVNKVLLGVVNGLRRMRALALYTSLRYVLLGSGLLVARAWSLEGAQLPVIWTFAEGGLLLVLLVELVSTVSLSRGRAWRAEARSHLAFGSRSVTATLAAEVTSKLDVWVLGTVVSNAQVGIYAIAAALYEGVTQLGVVVQNNLNPLLARALVDGRTNDILLLVQRTRRWFVPLLVAACAVGAVVYPFVIPWLLRDPAYAEGAVPFALLMLGVALASPYLPFAQVLLMAARPGWHTVYLVAVLAFALVANFTLIHLLGLVGAALATALGLVVAALSLRLLVRARTVVPL